MITLASLQRALGGEISAGQLLCAGPGHSAHDRSLSVKPASDKPGGFIVCSHSPSDDWRDCRDFVASKLGVDAGPGQTFQARPSSDVAPKDDVEKRKQQAVALWDASRDPRGTIVETYLSSRGLDLPPEMAGSVIRFHPNCPFGPGKRYPCMIAAFHHIRTGELVAVHRTALTTDGQKIDRKMLGPASGAAIKLDSGADGGEALAVGEGIETCLSGRLMGFSPVWAMGSAGGIASLPVLPGIKALALLAEQDENGANEKACRKCGDLWVAASREVTLVHPTAGNDLNDALQSVGVEEAAVIEVFEGSGGPERRGAVLARAVEPGEITIEAAGAITQDWIARVFAAEYADRLRFCHHTGAWFEWRGSHWQRDETDLAFHFVRELGRRLTEGGSEKELLAVRKVTFAGGVERFARADRVFAVTSEAWDRDPFLLGTPGGTVDLRTGVLRQSEPRDGITKLTAVTPADTADCPRWLQFLDETFGGDQDLVRFTQQWGGYSLTGDTREHALVFGYGGGGNGKSVFLNAITGVMKDYAVVAAMDTFIAAQSERHPTDLAMLRGARLVTASETEEGRAWAESRIKQLTGGDPISARFMRQDFFTFTPAFKLTIVGNHRPVLRNVDEAAKRRFNLVPFLLKPAQPDRQLEQKLKFEGPGILRWLIDGCLDWQANGLMRPNAVVSATEDYFGEQDLVGQWIDEECDAEPGNFYKTATIAELYESWAGFASKSGEDTGSKKQLSGLLMKRGFEKCVIGHGKARGFKCIRIKPKAHRDDD